jgi:DNA modification methylase
MNRLALPDVAAHDWYRFVLSYPPHLVRHYFEKFDLKPDATVLDPFCGTGTTIVEAKKQGLRSVGVEAHPMTHFASSVKVDWRPNPAQLVFHAERIAEKAGLQFERDGTPDIVRLRLLETDEHGLVRRDGLLALPDDAMSLLLKDSISPIPLHKSLVLLNTIAAEHDPRFFAHERLALAKALVYSISNLHFGPEVGVGKPKPDTSVLGPWLDNIRGMATDLERLQEIHLEEVPAWAVHADSRQAIRHLPPQSVDAVICSPPYPNEKDYTRTTRLETVLLGFARNKTELQQIKRGLVRSNTRTVYVDDTDDLHVATVPEIQRIAAEIERRRLALGKTSGFERMYHRVTKLYFGGMAKHFAELRSVLKPGAQLAYVVGDQASYLRVMIRTGQLLAEIAESLGYEVQSLDLFRTRLATATKEQLREEVVVLRWPGWS